MSALDFTNIPIPNNENDYHSVIKPKHYEPKHPTIDVEPLDLLFARGIGREFCVGNIIKLVCRYQEKDGMKDLQKASYYLNRLMQDIEDCAKSEAKSA